MLKALLSTPTAHIICTQQSVRGVRERKLSCSSCNYVPPPPHAASLDLPEDSHVSSCLMSRSNPRKRMMGGTFEHYYSAQAATDPMLSAPSLLRDRALRCSAETFEPFTFPHLSDMTWSITHQLSLQFDFFQAYRVPSRLGLMTARCRRRQDSAPRISTSFPQHCDIAIGAHFLTLPNNL